MEALPAPGPLNIDGGRRFIGHVIRPAEIPTGLRAAMVEVWDALLHFNELNLDLLPDNLTDRFLAQYLGRSRRFVQKGLHGLECGFERVVAGRHTGRHVDGIIVRHSGRGCEGRRRIQITGHLAARKDPKTEKCGRAGKPAPGERPAPRKAEPIPNVGFVREPSPNELAAAAAHVAKAEAEAAREPTPEEIEEGKRIAREWRAAIHREPRKRRLDPPAGPARGTPPQPAGP